MTLDPQTGLQLRHVYDVVDNWLEQNKEGFQKASEMLDKWFDVPEDIIKGLKAKYDKGIPFTGDDMQMLARATGDIVYLNDYLLNGKDIPQELSEKFFRHINNIFNLYERYSPKEVQDAKQ